ncbi:GH25 family lysozyme [Lactobacillus sp. CBA3606]|uniref:GH25 family lysozyme n=1 Tax=Lactobacillus sp. CBA3606 TaxID=2099789 RepID=UPI0018F87AD3|nr:GH25 family lysozyme [Lactobacillus sp. CBA3606]
MKVRKEWGLLLMGLSFLLTIGVSTKASAAVPDISEWQGQLTSTQVSSLKSQTSFVINRVQYGSGYEDIYHKSNENLYVKYGVPFGSYDYSTFTSTSSAVTDAKNFYARSNKNTKFYVLDFETTSMNSSTANAAVKAWYNEMRKLTSKKLIFYSYQSFATTYANSARQSFDAQWIANYSYRPTVSFSLWQYSSNYYLSALNQYVDNNLFDSASVSNYHPLSWWLNTSTAKPKTYAYSSYKTGQYAYVYSKASMYYDRSKVPSSAKQKMYKITAVKSVTKSNSKQLVYLSGLNQWVLSQDVGGYWGQGQKGTFTLNYNANIYSNAALSTKSGRTLAKGAKVTGTVVKYGKLYRVKLDGGGYITAAVQETNFTPAPKVYAYSSYKAGQYAYVYSKASMYYDRSKVPSSAKQKMYKITAVKSVTKSNSKQLLYLAGLNQWVLSQDVGGYWGLGQSGTFTLKYNANIYSNAALSKKSGRTLAKGAKVSGTVVKYGKLYRIRLTTGGYITAAVQETNH